MSDAARLADEIIRIGEERIRDLRAEQEAEFYEMIRARQPVLIYGVRYVPDQP